MTGDTCQPEGRNQGSGRAILTVGAVQCNSTGQRAAGAPPVRAKALLTVTSTAGVWALRVGSRQGSQQDAHLLRVRPAWRRRPRRPARKYPTNDFVAPGRSCAAFPMTSRRNPRTISSSRQPGGVSMPFVITDPCIGTKDTSCVDVCPVDCIHPKKDEPEFEHVTMLYIHPEESTAVRVFRRAPSRPSTIATTRRQAARRRPLRGEDEVRPSVPTPQGLSD